MRSVDPLARAKALFERSATDARTNEVLQRLDEAAAEADAHAAVTNLCRYLNRWDESWGPAELARFEAIIDRSLARDPHYYMALYARGFLYRARGQHAEGLAAFEETITYAPATFSRVHAQKGEQLLYLGRFDEAIAAAEHAYNLNKQSTVRGYFFWVMGRAYFFKRDYTSACEWLQRSVEDWPGAWYNRAYLAAAHAHGGNRPQARRVLAALHRRLGRHTLARVQAHEGATPCDHDDVKSGRDRFHEGLQLAGL
jgi:tetratricopeptide (TPR) repeat protein